MIKVLIVGPTRTGKSHVLLCLSKILFNAGMRILALDSTKSCGVQNFFHLHPQLEQQESQDKPLVINREGFDLMLLGSVPNKRLLDEHSQNYDAILVESDMITMGMTGEYSFVIFVQDCNLDSLIANEKLLKLFIEISPQTPRYFILNQYFPCKLSVRYICHALGINKDQINIIPFNIDDISTVYCQKVDGRLKLKSFSPEHNQVLFKLACGIADIENNKKNSRHCLTN